MTISTLVRSSATPRQAPRAGLHAGPGHEEDAQGRRDHPGAHPGQAGVAGIRSHRVHMGRNVREPVGDGGFTLESFDVHQGYQGSCPSACRWPWTGSRWTRRWVGPWTKTRGRGPDLPPGCLPDHRVLWREGRKIDTFRFTRPNVHSARKFNIELQAAAAETPGAAAQPLSAPELLSFLGASRTTPPLAPGWTSMASTTVRMRPLALTAMAPRRTRRCARRA